MTTYRVPFENGESAFTEKRSRFISHIWRVETEAEARERIEAVTNQQTMIIILPFYHFLLSFPVLTGR